MIVILEGTNGVGKSTIGAELSELTGAPVWRPFRPDPSIHWGQNDNEVGEKLRAAGLPLNTRVDDLYVADALRTLKPPSVILDRSLPSAYAYARIDKEQWIKDKGLASWLWKYWEDAIAAQPVLWVQLEAPYEVTLARCEEQGRWHPNKTQWGKLRAGYTKVFARTRIKRRMIVDVSVVDPKGAASAIARKIAEG